MIVCYVVINYFAYFAVFITNKELLGSQTLVNRLVLFFSLNFCRKQLVGTLSA